MSNQKTAAEVVADRRLATPEEVAALKANLARVTEERDIAIDQVGRIGADLAEVKAERDRAERELRNERALRQADNDMALKVEAQRDAALSACRAALKLLNTAKLPPAYFKDEVEACNLLNAALSGAPDPLRVRVEKALKWTERIRKITEICSCTHRCECETATVQIRAALSPRG